MNDVYTIIYFTTFHLSLTILNLMDFVKADLLSSNLCRLCINISYAPDEALVNDTVYLDYSRAFDSVDHKLLPKNYNFMASAVPCWNG